ncbi:unnamed protein product [Leptidea sinapis]|uniref:Uncharacterized protein n=1 Tax=Leptidea sinapis TaxID=189913 RepID=A0A5E4QCK5_9NEOP|nr:unnamed protein product [Leptidea sinapis]
MLGRNLVNLMIRTRAQPKFCVPKRNWAQVGHVISTPARVPVSYAEKVCHVVFMFTVWLSPVLYFLTQIKVWRRMYVQDNKS